LGEVPTRVLFLCALHQPQQSKGSNPGGVPPTENRGSYKSSDSGGHQRLAGLAHLS